MEEERRKRRKRGEERTKGGGREEKEGRKRGGTEHNLKVHLRVGGRESQAFHSLFILAGLRRSGRVKGLKGDARK